MPNPYSEIFKAPGAKGFASAGFVARLPIAMAPIGIVAMLSQTHGEYWLAGAVSATYALTNAVVAPQISRLVDRIGQTRVVVPTTVISVIAFAALIAAANQDWPIWTLFVSAFAGRGHAQHPGDGAGALDRDFPRPPRAQHRLRLRIGGRRACLYRRRIAVGRPERRAVPRGGNAGQHAVPRVRIGGIHRATRDGAARAGRWNRAARGSAIRQRPVQIITFALIFIGAIFATAEVSAVAITKELGQPSAASLVIGVYAVGSFVVGLIVGALNLKMPLQRQLAIAIGIIALTTLPLLFADTVPLLALAVFVSGVAISPTFITAFGLIERRVPAAMLTEGVTWVMTGIGIGMALGAFASGWVVDNFGAHNGFWVSVVAGTVSLLTVLLGQKSLAGERHRASPAPLLQAAE